MDWSAIFAGAALLLAVASPIITSLIQSVSSRKTRNDEFYLEYKARAIEQYARSACRMMYWDDKDSRAEYSKSFGELLIVVPNEIRDKLKKFDEIITDEMQPDYEEAKTLFYDICSDLSKHTPRVKENKRDHVHK